MYLINERQQLLPGRDNYIEVPIEEGYWFKKTARGQSLTGVDTASREEILMVLDNLEYVLIK